MTENSWTNALTAFDRHVRDEASEIEGIVRLSGAGRQEDDATLNPHEEMGPALSV